MPRYQYKCTNKKCEINLFDKDVPLKNYDKKVRCPECKHIVKRQFPAVPTHLSWSKWRAGHN